MIDVLNLGGGHLLLVFLLEFVLLQVQPNV